MPRRAFLFACLFALLEFTQSRTPNPFERLDSFIDLKEQLVINLAQYATGLHERRDELVLNCQCAKHACSNDFDDAKCVYHLGTPDICDTAGRLADFAATISRIPPDTNPNDLSNRLKESLCVYKRMLEFAKQHNDSNGWIYVGTRDGAFTRYPATARIREFPGGDPLLNFCQPYDPRLRPWYIGATTGPKDIVLVVDKSGSMDSPIDNLGGGETKWSLAQKAVRDILDTFTFADMINVVTFSEEAAPLWNTSGLARGTAENIAELKSLVSEETPGGNTSFAAAFETAFRLLTDECAGEREICSNCQKIILFLTDGRDKSEPNNESIKPSRMASVIDNLQNTLEQQTDKRASIFTYSLTQEADDAIPRQLACANNGSWAFIGPDTNTLDALNSYYLYVGAGRRTDAPIWIEPYLDGGHLGNVTTVAVPFYARGTNGAADVLLGVVGHQVQLHELQSFGLTLRQVLRHLISHTQRCVLSPATPCTLQVYRNAHDERSVCADPFPVGERAASEERNSVPCFQRGERFYKRFSQEVTWDEAESNCQQDGGQLVSIYSAAEESFVANLASADGSWIGARRMSTETTAFYWSDASIEDLREGSSFWGVQEPIAKEGTENCAAIDTRGATANMAAKPCDRQLSYICKYDANTSCSDGVRTVPLEGYFSVPPLEVCSAENLDLPQPTKFAQDLHSSQVLCPLGEPKSSKQVMCCLFGGSSILSATVLAMIVIVAVLLVLLVCLLCGWQRIRAWKNNEFG